MRAAENGNIRALCDSALHDAVQVLVRNGFRYRKSQ
jgi:hypothetical protein